MGDDDDKPTPSAALEEKDVEMKDADKSKEEDDAKAKEAEAAKIRATLPSDVVIHPLVLLRSVGALLLWAGDVVQLVGALYRMF